MGRPKLSYKFHDPNTPQVLAEYLANVFIESGAGKVEQAILAASLAQDKPNAKERQRPP